MVRQVGETHKLYKPSRPIMEGDTSLAMPNMGTTSLYCGCEMNSVMIRM